VLDPARISAAVREGLVVCLPSRSPLAQLLCYLHQLKKEGWGEDELIEIDKRIRHLLVRVAEDAPE
jgi:hypothetical protein